MTFLQKHSCRMSDSPQKCLCVLLSLKLLLYIVSCEIMYLRQRRDIFLLNLISCKLLKFTSCGIFSVNLVENICNLSYSSAKPSIARQTTCFCTQNDK